jgi:hypothetical protein
MKAARNSGSSGSEASSAARTHEHGEAQALLGRDRQVAVVGERCLVASECLGVGRQPAEDLDPPVGDVSTVRFADPAGEELA